MVGSIEWLKILLPEVHSARYPLDIWELRQFGQSKHMQKKPTVVLHPHTFGFTSWIKPHNTFGIKDAKPPVRRLPQDIWELRQFHEV